MEVLVIVIIVLKKFAVSRFCKNKFIEIEDIDISGIMEKIRREDRAAILQQDCNLACWAPHKIKCEKEKRREEIKKVV